MKSGGASPSGVTLVLGTSAGGIGAHVRMLAAGLCRQGIAVTVAGPSSADARFSFSAVPAVRFAAVEISAAGRPADLAAILRLRSLLRAGGGPPVVHAHGVRAGAMAALALLPARARRPRLVVTAHNAPPGGGLAGTARRAVYRLLELVTAREADLVLCVSPDLEARLRAAGARRVARAVIAAADAVPGARRPDAAAAAAGAGRPVVLAAGRLAAQKGLDVLLEAAAAWRDLDPAPLVVIAGDGPLARPLRARAVELGVPAVFLGHTDDIPARLAEAAVFVLPSRWEGQPLVLQEALRAGAAIVATRVGGVPGLTGEDAALLVPAGDARALGDAVRSVLTDPGLARGLAGAARARAAALPTESDAVAAALAAYAAVSANTAGR
jgi:glycosyltransferase involved in cell wall biosynthesis